jgi:hypothetical protein
MNPKLGLCGSTQNHMIHEKQETSKNAGSTVSCDLLEALKTDGALGDAERIRGTEGSTEFQRFLFEIDEYYAGTRSRGKIIQQRIPWDLAKSAREQLSLFWGERYDIFVAMQLAGQAMNPDETIADTGGNRIDGTDARFTGMNAVSAPTTMVYAKGLADAAAVAADSTAVLTLGLARQLKTLATMRRLGIRPVKWAGGTHYLMIVSPLATYGMKKDDDRFAAINLAMIQGGTALGNVPEMIGSLTTYEGVAFLECPWMPPAVDVNGDIIANTRVGAFVGAQSVACDFGQSYGKSRLDWRIDEEDYDRDQGIAAGTICGFAKTQYEDKQKAGNPKYDFATINFTTYVPEISDLGG